MLYKKANCFTKAENNITGGMEMKFIELQNYDSYSVILRLNDEGNLFACNPFVVAYKPNRKNGEIVDWGFGHYFDDLFNATDFARARGKHIPVQYYRLEEIAGKAIDGLIQDDEETAYEYLAREIEIDSEEAEYFGLDDEKLEEYRF